MAWSFSGHRGSANNKTSGPVLTVSPNQNVPVGAVLVAVAVSDNINTAGGASNTHLVGDFRANVWTKVLEFTNAAAAGAGITLSVWVSKLTAQIATSDTVILSLSASTTAKAIGLYEYAHGSGNSLYIQGGIASQQDATSSPTVTASNLPNRTYAIMGIVAREADTAGTYTQDSDYNDRTKFGTTGGAAGVDVSCIVGDRVVTATGDTFAPTALSVAADVVTAMVALYEVVPKPAGQLYYQLEDVQDNGNNTATVQIRVKNSLGDSGMVFTNVIPIPMATVINTELFLGYMCVRWLQGTPIEQLQSEVVRI